MNEEAWVYGVVKDYEYCLEKYPEKVKEFSSVKNDYNAELLEALLYFLDDREVVDFGEWFEEGCKIAKKATAKVERKI